MALSEWFWVKLWRYTWQKHKNISKRQLHGLMWHKCLCEYIAVTFSVLLFFLPPNINSSATAAKSTFEPVTLPHASFWPPNTHGIKFNLLSTACPAHHGLALWSSQPHLLFFPWFALPHPLPFLESSAYQHYSHTMAFVLMVPSRLNDLPIWLACSHNLGCNSCLWSPFVNDLSCYSYSLFK